LNEKLNKVESKKQFENRSFNFKEDDENKRHFLNKREKGNMKKLFKYF